VLEQTGENAYKVSIKVKVGPMSMTYKGNVEITERDEAAHRAVMKARAKESRGQGTADADVTMELTGSNGRTSATVTTEVEVSGKIATMGQGVLQDVSGRLIKTFAANLAAMLQGDAPAAAEVPAQPAKGESAAAPAQAEPSRPPRPTAAAEPADALDLGSIGGAMLSDLFKDPRRVAGLLPLVALVCFALGRRSARR
jgi:carbon monoxide dehydrogenase subunit G